MSAVDSNADELLFEACLPSPPDSQTCDPTNIFSDEILHDYLDDSQSILATDIEDDCEDWKGGSGLIRDKEWIIGRIEDMLERIVDGLLAEEEQLTINLKTRSGLSRRQLDATRQTGTLPPPRDMELNYPGNNDQDARRFTVVVRILELIHSCLIDNIVMTKRDVYYRHPDLFGKQSVVDRYVDDIACTLGISRLLLNVTAAAKGLMAGNFSIHRVDGTSVHGLSEPEGLLVPTLRAGDALNLSCLHWIVVIEKEATFRSVLSSLTWKVLGTQGLILTAKGYPDLISRKFLRQLADHSPHIPMYAVVDLDPDGVHIMSTYKYGSLRLAHEDAARVDGHGANLPTLQWLGVQSHHINRTPGNEGDTTTGGLADAQGVMKLTPRDRKKAHRLLEWGICGEHGLEPAWRAGLQSMLMLNVKAEMQILDEVPGGLVSWLSNQLEVMQSRSADDEILF